MSHAARRCGFLLGSAAILGLGAGLSASAFAGRPAAFAWFKPAQAPSSWKSVSVPSGGSILSYPPSLARVKSDRYSVSVGRRDASGRVAVYLNATPKEGKETLRGWPAFRLQHDRAETDAVHEHARVSGLRFIAGTGSCVIDDYVTRGKQANHYREIACFVQGRMTAGVIVAAALESDWTRSQALLRRAVEAYLVN